MSPSEDQVMLHISSETGTSRVPLRSSPARIGRIADNDVVLANQPTVSRHHAQLIFEVENDENDDRGESDGGGRWAVVDLGSHNGTHVNGVAVGADPVAVGTGDVIGIGSVTITIAPPLDVADLTVDDPGGRDLHQLLTALSPRERDVLGLVAAGRTDAQVGDELFISVKTVHSHLDRIRDKTGVRRRAELTRLAVRLGLSTHAS